MPRKIKISFDIEDSSIRGFLKEILGANGEQWNGKVILENDRLRFEVEVDDK